LLELHLNLGETYANLRRMTKDLLQKKTLMIMWVILAALFLITVIFIFVRNPYSSTQINPSSTTIETIISPSMLKYAGALGDWSGTWENMTYATTGSIEMKLQVAGSVLKTTINVDGEVFGEVDSEVIKAHADLMDSTLDPNLPDSTLLGEVVTQNFDADTGKINLVTKPPAKGVEEFSLEGQLIMEEKPKITGKYKVKASDNKEDAEGVISLKKKDAAH
jgi:hypothetical protein